MNKLTIAFLLLLFFTISTPVMAADSDGQFVGLGAPSCGEWVEARNENQAQATAFKSWVLGYFTAYNAQTQNVLNILGKTDRESSFLWLDQYCLENPLKLLVSGTILLTTELWPDRIITAPQIMSQK